MKFYWFNKNCCVPECFNSSTEGEGCFKEYFDLPAEPQARMKWLNSIFREDGENLKICEDHFKDDDVFRDKNNRKKLRLNSVPSMKLPRHICSSCLGSTNRSRHSADFEPRLCQCASQSTPLLPIQQSTPTGKRTRITWTAEEKRTLFRAIKKYGDVRVGNHKILINWTNVVSHCRSNGCFGNEKELRSVWQNIRVNSNKVYKNEIFGSKLERKVSRFLYGKPLKRRRSGILAGCSTTNESSNQTMSTDEENELNEKSPGPVFGRENGSSMVDETKENGEGLEKIELIDESDEDRLATDEEDDGSDEYYSISDVEAKFHIHIRPEPPKMPEEIISLLSSDDEE